MIGPNAVVKAFIKDVNKKFPIRTVAWLTPSTPIDYVNIMISCTDQTISMDMSKYCEDTVKMMETYMGKLTPTSVPITKSIPNGDEDVPLSSPDATLFRTGIGSIGWAASTVRIDLAYAHSRISQHMASPTQGAWDSLRHLMRYVKGHTTFRLTAPRTCKANLFAFFSDSDYAGNREAQNRCRSQLGLVGTINGAPFVYKSSVVSSAKPSKANTIQLPALSVGEAETYAASDATQAFMHMSYIADEMGIRDFPSTIPLGLDSTVAEAFMLNNCLKTRMKHIDARLQWVQILRDDSIVIPIKIDTNDNLADWLTKILPPIKFVKNRDALMRKD